MFVIRSPCLTVPGSGSQCPVAISLSSFLLYFRTELSATLHDFLFLKRTLAPPPHGSAFIFFPRFTRLKSQIFIPGIRSRSFVKNAPLFWDCKGKNLFLICNFYFNFFFLVRTNIVPVLPGCKGNNLFLISNIYFHLFFHP